MEVAIEAHDLGLAYGSRPALDGVSLQVASGEVCGVLGPNGAGKTTTIRVLTGLLRPTRGWSRVLGLDPALEGDRVRALAGVLTEAPSLYAHLTAHDNLAFFGTLFGLGGDRLARAIATALEAVGLEGRAHERAGGYSRGMKQRLAIARAILHDPPVLFLDEPTAGLDPVSAAQINALVGSLRDRGRTIFLCTHHLGEAERACDRYLLFSRGRVLAAGTRRELAERVRGSTTTQARLAFAGEPPADLQPGPGVLRLDVRGAALEATLESLEALPGLVAAAVAAGGRILRVEPVEPTLDGLYAALMADTEARA